MVKIYRKQRILAISANPVVLPTSCPSASTFPTCSRAVSPSPCVDRRAPITRPVSNSVGGKCRMNECRRHERRRHHPLSTGARRATSASRGAERSAAPTYRPKSAAIGRRANQIAGRRPSRAHTPPKSRAQGCQSGPKTADFAEVADWALFDCGKHYFYLRYHKVLANQKQPIFACTAKIACSANARPRVACSAKQRVLLALPGPPDLACSAWPTCCSAEHSGNSSLAPQRV